MKKLLDIRINDKFGDYTCVGSFFDATSRATKYIMKCEKCSRGVSSEGQHSNQRRTLTCEVIFPDNTKLIIKNLRKFCREHSLDYSSCREILFRQRISLFHKGYTFNKIQEM